MISKREIAYVLGNGPSLKSIDFKEAATVTTFGMNAAYRFWHENNWYPDYYSCLDEVVGLSHKDEIADLIHNAKVYGIRGFLIMRNLASAIGSVNNLDRVRIHEEVSKKSELMQCCARTTGSHTLAWASDLGYKNIYVWGVDCNYKEIVEGSAKVGEHLEIKESKSNPNYFFDGYQRIGDEYNIPNPIPNLHVNSWRNLAMRLRHDVVVRNASLLSEMDAFDICDPDYALQLQISNTSKRRALFGAGDWLGDDEEIKYALGKSKIGPYPRDRHASIDECELVSRFFESYNSGVMFDVGAHKGTSLKHFLDKEWKIYAYEPDKTNFAALRNNVHESKNVVLSGCALSNNAQPRVQFYSSPESTGISSLSPFTENHEFKHNVETRILKDELDRHKIAHIDLLKIDTEGHDLSVLQGMDWSTNIVPRVIICEFENAKSNTLGYKVEDLISYLQAKNYYIFVSEWHPIIRYGKRHDWKSIYPYREGENIPEDAWGNLIAFAESENPAAFWKLASSGNYLETIKFKFMSGASHSRIWQEFRPKRISAYSKILKSYYTSLFGMVNFAAITLIFILLIVKQAFDIGFFSHGTFILFLLHLIVLVWLPYFDKHCGKSGTHRE